MSFEIKHENNFKYCEQGTGEPIVLLHGLFGALSNFNFLIKHFEARYTVAIPLLPLFELDTDKTTITGMLEYLEGFIDYKGYPKVHLIGNSLGGHIAQLYALKHPGRVATLTLTGSSGLFENSLGDTYPRKGDYEYVKKKTENTFYDPALATPELIEEVFNIVNDRARALRIVILAKSAIRHNLRDEVHKLNMPACLIWGKQDSITPSFVGEEFHKLLPDSELHILDQCGHAPMMEKPEVFNQILEQFLQKHPVNT